MSAYVVIRNIQVQNANAITGLTYGFPGITHFLGFVHALSRYCEDKLDIGFNGVGVVCHQAQLQAQPGHNGLVFGLTRNPLKSDGKTAAFVEEGRINLEVSLILACDGLITGDQRHSEQLIQALSQRLPACRIAGGQVINQPTVNTHFIQETKQVKQLLYSLLPGFVLVDRKDYLAEHHARCLASDPNASLLDAWLDYSALMYEAEQGEAQPNEEARSNTDQANAEPSSKTGSEPNQAKQADAAAEEKKPAVVWSRVDKPHPGFLVPLAVGYHGISPKFAPGVMQNSRDNTISSRFVEYSYSIGEWLGAHRVNDMADIIWRYHPSDDWYLARCDNSPDDIAAEEGDDEEFHYF